MPFNPELVDASDLNDWASRREAQELLPRLIRHLLRSTPGATGLSVRAGEGIGVPGWDGRADGGAGTAYMPRGPSCWELGTSEDPRDQAQDNYRKRTADPQGATPVSTAFVFVTLRRWGQKDHKDDKDAWVQARQAEGRWREVVALDADDLEGWLEAAPDVHIWLSERMGRRPFEVQTLDRWWESWSTQTRPPLPAELLLAGRCHQARELRRTLQGAADVIGLRAGARDEAIAFLAASLIVPDEPEAYLPGDDPLSAVLVISTPQTWARLARSRSHNILVPTFDAADAAAAVDGGHSVIVPMGSSDRQNRASLELPPLARDEARQALQTSGWSFERANRHAAQARRSLQSLRRELAVNPLVSRPGWTRHPVADLFASLMLVGSWSAESDDDCGMVAAAADRKYADLDRTLVEWAATEDPPFRYSAGTWRLAASLDAWTLLRPSLTRDDLARWHDAALRVLSEPDPALELSVVDRPFAAIHGVQRRWSKNLRWGLAQGAALLGAAGHAVLSDGRTGSEHASALVRELLAVANGDATGHVWQSLVDVLPLLAEAAPQEFLDGIDDGLTGDPPLLRRMFTDADDPTPWGVSSPHSGLLWAIETVCWSQEYLSHAANALARLAEIDPGGRLANRPRASLRDIFLPWAPQTSAQLQRRITVLDGLFARHPGVGWPLLLALLPQRDDFSSGSHTPTFRDWVSPDAVTLAEYLNAVSELVDRALAAAARHPKRWAQLVDRLSDLPPRERDRCLDALESVVVDTLDPEDRLTLWTTVTELGARHRQFSTAAWALPDESLKRLEAIAARLEPVDTAERHAYLFDWRPDLPGIDKLDYALYDKALEEVRRASVREALEYGGIETLIHLAEKSKVPRLVGVIAAKVGGENLAAPLLPELVAEGPRRELAVGWVIGMSETPNWDWVHRAFGSPGTLPERARSVFYLSLPAEPRTWALVDADAEIVQGEYYCAVNPFGVAADYATSFAGRLLDHGRPWSAIDLLVSFCDGKDEAAKPPAEVIERALRAALDREVLETPRPGALDYDLGVLLDRLEATGASADTLFQLEWAYLPLLGHFRGPRAIHARLAAEPHLFVEAVHIASDHEQEVVGDANSLTSTRRRNCDLLLRNWRRPPGTSNDGTIDSTVLRSWVDEARRLFAQHGCSDIGDVYLGKLLSGSPPGSDGIWPAEPVRDITEDLANKNFENGLIAGKFYSRGATSRGVFDGGRQEAALAHQFRSWAEQVEDRWRRTGQMLWGLADWYAEDARREDASAAKRADEG